MHILPRFLQDVDQKHLQTSSSSGTHVDSPEHMEELKPFAAAPDAACTNFDGHDNGNGLPDDGGGPAADASPGPRRRFPILEAAALMRQWTRQEAAKEWKRVYDHAGSEYFGRDEWHRFTNGREIQEYWSTLFPELFS